MVLKIIRWQWELFLWPEYVSGPCLHSQHAARKPTGHVSGDVGEGGNNSKQSPLNSLFSKLIPSNLKCSGWGTTNYVNLIFGQKYN